MQIKFKQPIESANLVDLNTITAVMKDGTALEVTRRMEHWQPMIEIKLDGVIWHRGDADKAAQKFFNDLSKTAFAMMSIEREQAGAMAHQKAKAIFDWK